MKITDKWTDHQGNVFYTVELETDIAIDIKIVKETGLIYDMQNHDGSTVYRTSTRDSIPGYHYDEKAAIALVAAKQ